MSNASNHWEKTKSLLFKTLAVWAFAFIIHFFGNSLNVVRFWRLFHGLHGCSNSLRNSHFWFVSKQGQIDDEHGVSE